MSNFNLLELLGSEMRKNATSIILYHQDIAKKLGLNATDHKCLEMILNNRSVTAGMIKDYTGLTTGAVTGVIDRLEKLNFVRREHDPTDRRRIFIKINKEKAMQAITPLFEPLGEDVENMLSNYRERDLDFLLCFYKHFNNALDKQRQKFKEGNK